MDQWNSNRPMNILYLPATEPDDDSYGRVPLQFTEHPDVRVNEISYPHMVWYNEEVRAEAIRQIGTMPESRFVLVGFSKSGLGAWHLARALPERIAATIIFDSPVTLERVPHEWGAGPFYADDQAWRRDLPVLGIADFRRGVSPGHRLILISGEGFHADMQQLSLALDDAGCDHTFLPHPEIRHHWNAGWVELGLAALAQS